MDNEAFRALVQERAKVKSTKEIAREAVEEEFRSKRKKRKRGGGSSSEEESEDYDSDQEEPRKSQQDLLIPLAAQTKARSNESRYRDRAKERREGKNVDYEAQASLLEGVAYAADGVEMDQVTMSKYLGGDEAHTHLVKGLDVALARRIKREMDNELKETDLDTTNSLPTNDKAKKSIVAVRNADEARALLQHIKTETVTSELGRQMLNHMKTVHLPPRDLSQLAVRKSPGGFAIQRSNLTFACFGDPRNRVRAWELPLESVQASSKADLGFSDTEANGATSLDVTALRQIRHAFSHHSGHAAQERQDMTGGTPPESQKVEGDEDVNDDIFDDIDDYVPPTETESKSTLPVGEKIERRAKPKSGSIFDGLDTQKPPPERTSNERVSSHSAHKPSRVSKERNVLSRDLLGSVPHASSKSLPRVGVSVSSYDGGYGEEMDVDFDGLLAVEEDKEGGAKKKKHKTKRR